jgi:hypothetical protein
VGKGVIGFGFTDAAGGKPHPLNWLITADLTALDPEGRAVPSATKVKFVGEVHAGQIVGQRFYVPATPSNYRVDITIGRRDGVILGKYSEYFRVVAPIYRARIALSDLSPTPGTSILARVENVGTDSILPSSRIVLERLVGGEWVREGVMRTPGLKPQIRAVLPGGMSSRCAQLKLPIDQVPGLYRLTSKVSRLSKSEGGMRELTKTFQIHS